MAVTSGSTHQTKSASKCDGAKTPQNVWSFAVKWHRRTRGGRVWKEEELHRAQSVIVMRQSAGGQARPPCSTATRWHESRKPETAETQQRRRRSEWRAETESRGRVPSKCQAPNKSALMEEVCLEESTECSPAKCTWLALHTQTRTHVLMTGRRRSRARPLRGAQCDEIQQHCTLT